MKFIKYEVLELTDEQKRSVNGEIPLNTFCDAVEILTEKNISVMSLFNKFKDRIVDVPYVEKDIEKYLKEVVKLSDEEIENRKLISQKMGNIDPIYEREDRDVRFSNLTDETRYAQIYQIGSQFVLIDLSKVPNRTVYRKMLFFKKLDVYEKSIKTIYIQKLKEWNCHNVVDEYNMLEGRPFAAENYVDCDQERGELKYIQTQIEFDKIKKFFRSNSKIRRWELADNEVIKIKDK